MTQVFIKKIFRPLKQPPLDRVAENEEWGDEPGGILTCPACGNVHYEKKWHHVSDIPRNHLIKAQRRTRICPACKMIRAHTFEGEIFIENFPVVYKEELFALINAFGKRASEMDPQDRIIIVEKKQKRYWVATTENQLAVKLAKKIRHVFHAPALEVSYLPEPAEVVRINIPFSAPQSRVK